MPDGGQSLPRVLTMLVTAWGLDKAKRIVANKYGADSHFYALLMQFAPDVIHGAGGAYDNVQQYAVQQQGLPLRIGSRQYGTTSSDFEQGMQLITKGSYWDALTCFKKASDAGSAEATTHIGLLLMDLHLMGPGETPEGEFRAAMEWFELAVKKGDRTAAAGYMYALGMHYDNGERVAKDEAKAHECYLKAARAGCILASFSLATNYRRGCGIQKDLAVARQWYELFVQNAEGDETYKRLLTRARDCITEIDTQEKQARSQREQGQRQQQSAGGGGGMIRAQALEVIDMPEGTSKQDMKAKWVRLMQQNHPDRGGSNFFAKQLNEARQVLGF